MKTLMLGFVLLLASAATIAGQTGAPPPLVKEGVTVNLGVHSYAIPDGNVGMVPNVGIIVGDRATLVIDPGMGRRNGETVLREVNKVSKNSELYVATTHFHVEHTLGYLGMPNAKYINSNVQEAEFAENWMAQAKTFASRGPIHAEVLAGATARKAEITFDREYTLDLGGVRVRMLVVGPTHTRGDTIFFVEGDNVLYAGDVVMKESFVAANQSSSMKAWLTAFDVLEKMNPRTVVPAHGPIGEGSLIAANRAFMQEIQSRARALKAQGQSVEEVAATIQKEMQVKHPNFARLNGAVGAARSAYAEAQ